MTAYVDEVLDPAAAAAIEAHLASGCLDCTAQVDAERDIRRRLAALPAVDPPAGLEARIRWRLKPRPPLARRLVSFAAAAALVAGLWIWRMPAALGGMLVADHEACTLVQALDLPEPGAPSMESVEGALPGQPREAAGLTLTAATICRLKDDSLVTHFQYTDPNRRVSVFVMRRRMLMRDGWESRISRSAVLLTRAGEVLVGFVGDRPEDLRAVERGLTWRATAGASPFVAALQGP